MNLAHRINPAWRELIRISARQFYAYRLDLAYSCAGFVIQLYVLRVVWEAVYAGRDEVDGISSQVLLVYLSISALHRYFFSTAIAYEIQHRVTSGTVAHALVRPFGFLKQMTAMHIGNSLAILPALAVFVPGAMLVGSLDPPGPANAALYLVSIALALVVDMLIWMHVGMLAFWMMHVNGVRAMLQITSSFLAGAMVPLWLMPDGLRTVLTFLPFQATVFLPASIYSEQQGGMDVVIPLAQQAGWIVVLVFTARIVWRRAQRKIVVQGG